MLKRAIKGYLKVVHAKSRPNESKEKETLQQK